MHDATPIEVRALWLLRAVVTAALVVVLLPFFGSILWAGVIALLFAPLQARLLPLLRHRPTAAALVTTGIAVLLVVGPALLLAAALAREAAGMYARLQSGTSRPVDYLRGVFDALPAPVASWLDRVGLVDFEAVQQRLTTALAQGAQFIATQAVGIGQNTFQFVLQLFVSLYLAFFLIRDGRALVRIVRDAMPLARADSQALARTFAAVIRATVRGNLVVAALQGLLGGLAFWALGVSGAVLWAVVMGVLSLVPAVGAGLVWAPLALYYALTGAPLKGLALLAWGVLAIGLVDNLLRPLLVGRDLRLPDYVVLVSTLGGLSAFGIHGLVLGPATAAFFVALWHVGPGGLGRAAP